MTPPAHPPSVRVLMRLLLMIRMLVFMGSMVGRCMLVPMPLFPRAMSMFMLMLMAMGMFMFMIMLMFVDFLPMRVFMLMNMQMLVFVIMLMRMFAFHRFSPF